MKNSRIITTLISLFLLLATLSLALSGCYDFSTEGGYRTMPVGTGTSDDRLDNDESVTLPAQTTAELTTDADVTTLSPDLTTDDVTTEAEETTLPAVIVTYDYEVVSVTTDISNAGGKKSQKTLRYPKLTGLEDTAKQENINSLLSQIAEVEYQKIIPNAAEIVAGGVTVNYEITATAVTYLGNNLLSVRSEGEVDYSDDSDDQTFVYCNIINLSTERDITLKKTYSDFGSIITLFTSGSFKKISGSADLGLSPTELTDMMEQYKYYDRYGTYPESYFTETELIIVVELGKQKGYFAEFSIPLSEVNSYLLVSPQK